MLTKQGIDESRNDTSEVPIDNGSITALPGAGQSPGLALS
jgi:hypothetical protein